MFNACCLIYVNEAKRNNNNNNNNNNDDDDDDNDDDDNNLYTGSPHHESDIQRGPVDREKITTNASKITNILKIENTKTAIRNKN